MSPRYCQNIQVEPVSRCERSTPFPPPDRPGQRLTQIRQLLVHAGVAPRLQCWHKNPLMPDFDHCESDGGLKMEGRIKLTIGSKLVLAEFADDFEQVIT